MTKGVLITGVSSGIGLAQARLFLEKGYQVYGVDQGADPQLAGDFHFMQRDLTLDLTPIFDWCPEVEVLCNTAGVLDDYKPLLEQSAQDQYHALLLLDLDDFKRINDTYGHQTGDQVIREVADRLRALFRNSDVLGRWGGDEFVVFLPGFSDLETIRTRLATLQEKMKAFKNGNVPLPITLSTDESPNDFYQNH